MTAARACPLEEHPRARGPFLDAKVSSRLQGMTRDTSPLTAHLWVIIPDETKTVSQLYRDPSYRGPTTNGSTAVF